MIEVDIRPVVQFAEPDFSRIRTAVRTDLQQTSAALGLAHAAERAAASNIEHTHPRVYHLGAYIGEELVGWSSGWMERASIFQMADSGVVAAQRRKGIYSHLLAAVCVHALALGAVAVRSKHSVMNNAVIIAKLKAGFFISGFTQSAEMGTMVELTRPLYPERLALWRKRVLPYVVP